MRKIQKVFTNFTVAFQGLSAGVANELGLIAPLFPVESIGEVRKGKKIAVFGFPLKIKK